MDQLRSKAKNYVDVSYLSVKSVAVAVGCVIVALAIVIAFVSPGGQQLFMYVRDSTPFVGAVLDTSAYLTEAGFLNELITTAMKADVPELGVTLSTVMLDMAKVGFGATLAALLMKLFSKLFLNLDGIFEGKLDLVHPDSLTGFKAHILEKAMRSPLYIINHAFLLTYASFFACLASNLALYMLQEKMTGWSEAERNWASLGVLLIAAVVFVLKDFLRKKGAGKALRISLLRLLLCKGLPETVGTFMKSVLAVVFVSACRGLGWHALTVLAAAAYLCWAVLAKLIDQLMDTFVEIIGKLPYLGQRSRWFSDFFWQIASVSSVLLAYIVCSPNYSESGDIILSSISRMPFLTQFILDMPMNGYLTNFPLDFAVDIAGLFIICVVVSVLQYLSSSFKITMITQVFLRFLFIVGFFLLAVMGTNAVLNICWPFITERIAGYESILFLSVMMGLLLLLLLQPKVMVQAGLATVFVILTLHFVPYAFINFSGAAGAASDRLVLNYIMCALLMDAVGALASLFQNIFNAFMPKLIV